MLISGVALGLAAGFAFGGRATRLGELPVRWMPLLLLALAVRIVGLVVPFSLGLYLAALVAVAAAAAANRHLPGAPLIAAGSALNVAVVALNAGMPVDPGAAEAASMSLFGGDRLHVPLTGATVAPLLADVIPVALVRGVYSLGDVLIAAGGFWLPFDWLRRR